MPYNPPLTSTAYFFKSFPPTISLSPYHLPPSISAPPYQPRSLSPLPSSRHAHLFVIPPTTFLPTLVTHPTHHPYTQIAPAHTFPYHLPHCLLSPPYQLPPQGLSERTPYSTCLPEATLPTSPISLTLLIIRISSELRMKLFRYM